MRSIVDPNRINKSARSEANSTRQGSDIAEEWNCDTNECSEANIQDADGQLLMPVFSPSRPSEQPLFVLLIGEGAAPPTFSDQHDQIFNVYKCRLVVYCPKGDKVDQRKQIQGSEDSHGNEWSQFIYDKCRD